MFFPIIVFPCDSINYFDFLTQNSLQKIKKKNRTLKCCLFFKLFPRKLFKNENWQVFWLTPSFSGLPIRKGQWRGWKRLWRSLQQRDCPGFAPDSLLIVVGFWNLKRTKFGLQNYNFFFDWQNKFVITIPTNLFLNNYNQMICFAK